MSGNSGPGFSGSGSGSEVACEDIVITTQLASPKAAVVLELKEGDFLEIVVESNTAGQPLLVAKYQGKTAGGITHPGMFRLLECIKNGTVYVGEVLTAKLGLVKVKIHAKK